MGNIYILYTILGKYGNLRCYVFFQEILNEMTTKGIEPNAVFDAAMVVAHCALGDIESAMTVLEEMSADGVPANRQVFHALIREEVWSESLNLHPPLSNPESLNLYVYLWYDLTGNVGHIGHHMMMTQRHKC